MIERDLANHLDRCNADQRQEEANVLEEIKGADHGAAAAHILNLKSDVIRAKDIFGHPRCRLGTLPPRGLSESTSARSASSRDWFVNDGQHPTPAGLGATSVTRRTPG